MEAAPSLSFPSRSQVLWPFLLEFVKPAEYTEAFGILSRCVAHIGGKKRESDVEDYFINFEEQGGCGRVCVYWQGVLQHWAGCFVVEGAVLYVDGWQFCTGCELTSIVLCGLVVE